MAPADLHLHSTASDGLLPPRDVVRMAYENEIEIIALTDHDTTDGLEEACAAGREFSIRVIPGIELSTEMDGEEIHILGYYTNPASEKLQSVLQELREARLGRIKAIIQKLNQLGFDLTWEEVSDSAADASSIGRPHVARVMVQKRYAASVSEVFGKWIGLGCPAFVNRFKLTPKRAIEVIHSVGGIAFLAHPGLLKQGISVAKSLVPAGLDGVEVFHTDHSERDNRDFLQLAKSETLYISGGSDCHGIPGDIKIGRVTISTALIQPWLKD